MPAPGWSPGVPRLITGPQHGGALGDVAQGQSGAAGGARRAPARWRTQPGVGELGQEWAGKLGQAAGCVLGRHMNHTQNRKGVSAHIQNGGKKILANIQNIFYYKMI
jgi:hypothetical protein